MSEAPGYRHPLVLYKVVISRFRRPAFILSLLLLGLWLPVSRSRLSWPAPSAAPWLFAGGAVAALFWGFTLIGPQFTHAQARSNHLRIRTPIYRLNVSYRRVESTHPVKLAKEFAPGTVARGHRKLIEPFIDHTALGVDLHEYPLHPLVLRLFLHPLFLAPDRTGLVLIVDDWMKLSAEISDRMGVEQGRDERDTPHFSDAARILAEGD